MATTTIRAALVLGLFLPSLARAERSFLGGRSVELPSRASHLNLGDWDGDGLLDAAVVGTEHSVHVLRGLGGALFVPSASLDVGRNPIYVTHGDFDGSGQTDILTVNAEGISVFLNAGNGSFLESRDASVGFGVLEAGLGDFNSDGRIDVVLSQVSSPERGGVRVLLGEGDGSFREGRQLDMQDNPHSLVVDDFNGDGLSDVAVAHTRILSFLASRGDGTFRSQKAAVLEPLNLNPHALAGGDFEGDGSQDLLVFGEFQGLFFLRNDGTGFFHAKTISRDDLPFRPALGAVDFTGDGRTDIFVGSGRTGAPGVHIHPGLGDGTFEPRRDIFLGFALGPAVLRDIDADGLVDLVGARSDDADFVAFAGTGLGEIARPFQISLPGGTPRDLIPLDLAGDGAEDIAILDPIAVHVLRSGGGGIPATVTFPGSVLQGGTAADFDGDGLHDIALSDFASPRVLIAILDRIGAVARTLELPVAESPHRLEAADFDLDGALDLVVTDSSGPAALVLLAPGIGGAPGRLSLAAGPFQSALCTSDLDGDGAEDVAVQSRTGISVFFGGAPSPLERSLLIDGGANSAAMAASDLDDDGAAELLAADGSDLLLLQGFAEGGKPSRRAMPLEFMSQAIAVLEPAVPGNVSRIVLAGQNTLAEIEVVSGGALPPEAYPFGYLVRDMVISDVDGDSRLDCVVADLKGLSVLRGLGMRPSGWFRRGEVDGDGTLLLTDAIRILERLFLGAAPLPCPDASDANDDGILTLTDGVFVLLHLFLGGAPPPDPGPEACGPDPTTDDLGVCSRRCE